MFFEKYNGTGGCLAVIRVRVTYFDLGFCRRHIAVCLSLSWLDSRGWFLLEEST